MEIILDIYLWCLLYLIPHKKHIIMILYCIIFHMNIMSHILLCVCTNCFFFVDFPGQRSLMYHLPLGQVQILQNKNQLSI